MVKPFCFLLERVLTILTVDLHHRLLSHGINLSHSEIVALYALNLEPGSSPSYLSYYLNKDRAALKRTIDALLKKGYAFRERKDRKEFCLYLTDEGLKVIPVLQEVVKQVKQTYFSDVPDEDLKKVVSVFKHIFEVSNKEKEQPISYENSPFKYLDME